MEFESAKWLERWKENLQQDSLIKLIINKREVLQRPHWEEIRQSLWALKESHSQGISFDFSSPDVSVNSTNSFNESLLDPLIQKLIPWRKGPFRLFDLDIDAEWKSNLKWERISPHIDPLKGKRVIDVGSGNGYYMFRMLAEDPELVLGLDPFELFYFQFELFQQFIKSPKLGFELLGVEHAHLFTEFFDVALCMGVIYHRKSPVEVFEHLKMALKPGGQLILETIGIPGTESVSLSPPGRYQMMRNVFHLPTESCLISWAKRAGFVDCEIISSVKITSEEQRKTKYMPFDSLADHLDPNDPNKTIEGYTAPLRFAVSARKPDKKFN